MGRNLTLFFFCTLLLKSSVLGLDACIAQPNICDDDGGTCEQGLLPLLSHDCGCGGSNANCARGFILLHFTYLWPFASGFLRTSLLLPSFLAAPLSAIYKICQVPRLGLPISLVDNFAYKSDSRFYDMEGAEYVLLPPLC
jgi:hypothetical protein